MIIIYRPPKLSKALFLTELADLLSICSTEYDRALLTGDYNLHVDNASDAMAMDFLKLLDSFDFTQHIAGPTQEHGHTLDLVISRGLDVTFDRSTKTALSDHQLLCFSMLVPEPRRNSTDYTTKKRFFWPVSSQ